MDSCKLGWKGHCIYLLQKEDGSEQILLHCYCDLLAEDKEYVQAVSASISRLSRTDILLQGILCQWRTRTWNCSSNLQCKL